MTQKLKPGDRIAVGPALCDLVACPCGGKFQPFEHALIHSEPFCLQFLEMEPSAYVRWVRLNYKTGIRR